MVEQLERDDFKPLVPVYAAYPLPLVLEEIDLEPRTNLREIFFAGENVVNQIVSAATDKPKGYAVARVENHIPMRTRHNKVIERRSFEQKIKGDPEVSRQISDTIQMEGLGGENSVFDRLRMTVHQTEFRGDKFINRMMDIGSWNICFYKPGSEKPAAKVYKGENAADSYIEVREEDKREVYRWDVESDLNITKPLEELADDHPEILVHMEAAIKEAQASIMEYMVPAVDNREIVLRRSSTIGFRDPHTRHIGIIARLSDRLIQLRNK